MKSKYAEQKLKKDVEETTPDVLNYALERCARENQVHSKAPRKPIRWRACAALAAALVLVIGLGFFTTGINSVDSVIGLDVNPSIEIKINSREKVLSVEALNKDAEKILDDMELAGTELKVAVNAIVGSMYTNGYISNDQNSVLVSVKSRNAGRGENLRRELSGYVANALEAKQVEGAVISSVLNIDTIYTWAEKCGISEGKAALIEAILNADPTHSLEELAKLNITDLNLLAQAKEVQDLNVSGSAGSGKYIGVDRVKELVMDRLPGCRITETEMDWEDGRMVYEGEAFLDNTEYEFEIDAVSGEFLKWEKENDAIVPGNCISREEVKNTIYGKLSQKAVIAKLELDKNNGRMVYEGEAFLDNTEYEFEIDAVSGEILKWNKDSDAIVPGNCISREEAENIIYGKLPQGAVIAKLELDEENGRRVYEAEAYGQGNKYDIEIDAITGEVVKLENEKDDDYDDHQFASCSIISYDDARKAILKKYPGGNITELKYDYEDGKYEGEVIVGNIKYEFEISAASGKFIKLEKELNAGKVEVSAERAKKIIMSKLPGCTVIEMELDEDNGIPKYEGEAILNNKEYEFEIDAVSGAILELEIED